MVRVEQHILPVGFILVEISVPIFIGRLFLATTRAMTDWEEDLVVLRVGGESVYLSI